MGLEDGEKKQTIGNYGRNLENPLFTIGLIPDKINKYKYNTLCIGMVQV
jgi:hypothetical protein